MNRRDLLRAAGAAGFAAAVAGAVWGRAAYGRSQLAAGLMADALPAMEAWLHAPTEARSKHLRDLLGRAQAEQNEHRRIHGGPVRIIHDGDLLLIEYALHLRKLT